jgi:transposase
MKITRFGLDLANRVFQLPWIDERAGDICRRQMERDHFIEFFANREPAVVAMEACGSAHYWARKLKGLGQEVRLIAAQFVHPIVKSNKTDAADALRPGDRLDRQGTGAVSARRPVLRHYSIRLIRAQANTRDVGGPVSI